MLAVILRRVLLAVVGAMACVSAAVAQTSGAAIPVELGQIMTKYAAALNSNDADTLVNFYSPKGVFMREDLPAVVGIPALRASYRDIFTTLKLNLQFTIDEAEEAGDMAWLRAVTHGKVKVLATGKETDEAFNAMVVFRKEGGVWKIRSYLYASSKAGPQPPK